MLDADDISISNRLKIQFDYMEIHKRIGARGAKYSLNSETGREIGVLEKSCNYKEFQLRILLDNYMLQFTLFVSSYLLKKYQITYMKMIVKDIHSYFCNKHLLLFKLCFCYTKHIHSISDQY